jgi:hypothetical protein
MTAPVKAATLPEVPAEVLSLAAEKGVGNYLYPVLEMTARLFPGCPLTVTREHEWEDPYEDYIQVHADVSGWSVERVVDAHRQWCADLAAYCPRSHTFYFGLSFAGSK